MSLERQLWEIRAVLVNFVRLDKNNKKEVEADYQKLKKLYNEFASSCYLSNYEELSAVASALEGFVGLSIMSGNYEEYKFTYRLKELVYGVMNDHGVDFSVSAVPGK